MAKKTIVLLSGWLHNFENETEFINELKKYFNIFIIKYPGYYGVKELKDLPAKYDLSKYVYSKIRELNLKNYYLLGFSMGCQVVLHTVKSYNLKNEIILISPTTRDLMSEVPFLFKWILKNKLILRVIRENNYLSKLIVSMAFRKISIVTENEASGRIEFNNPSISMKGAFDTLYFLITNFIDPKNYTQQAKLIFGDKEILQKELRTKEYTIISDCGHGDFERKYKELVGVIKNLISSS